MALGFVGAQALLAAATKPSVDRVAAAEREAAAVSLSEEGGQGRAQGEDDRENEDKGHSEGQGGCPGRRHPPIWIGTYTGVK